MCRPQTPVHIQKTPPKCAKEVQSSNISNLFKKDFFGQTMIMWDMTKHGIVRNYFSYSGVVVDVMKEAWKIQEG